MERLRPRHIGRRELFRPNGRSGGFRRWRHRQPIRALPDNSFEAITAGFPTLGVFPRAAAFDSTAWHHIDLLFNMPAQTYSIALDGSTLASNLPFCGNNSGPCSGAPLPTYGIGFFDSFGQATFGSNPGSNDSGYIDNFQVAVVPEPSTVLGVITGLGVLGLGLKRRSKASQ